MTSNPEEQSVSPNPEHLGRIVNAQATLNPDNEALISPGLEPLTFGQLQQLIDSTGNQLREFGVKPWHRVGVVLPNSSAMAALSLCLMNCCSLVPLNPGYSQREFEYFYSQIGVDILISRADDQLACVVTAAKQQILVIDFRPSERESGQFLLKFPATKPSPGSHSGENEASYPLILHTSGSTANPKIVPLSHANILASVDNLVASLQLSDKDRCLNMMPLFHVGALVDLLLSPLSAGGSVVVTEKISGADFLDCLQSYQPSWYQAVPTMLKDVVTTIKSRPDLLPEKMPLRLVRSVSSALPNRLLHEVESLLDSVVIEIYGMTETSGLICSNPLESGRQKQGSVGTPQGCLVKIVTSSGKPVKTGQRGEIIIKGDGVMLAYENKTDNRHNDFIDGYFRSGDEGYFDDEGYLYLTGRIKEIINRGGEKISPLEIDRVAESYPGVQAAAAFAIAHPTLGEEIGLAIVKDSHAGFNESEFFNFLESSLSAHKLPRRIYYPDMLPRAAGGKLKRYEIGKRLIEQENENPRQTWIKPETPVAIYLAKLWSHILEVENIGVQDNFFDLGGDSLSAAAFIGELKQQYPDLDASALYENKTIQDLENYLLGLSAVGGPDLDSAPQEYEFTETLKSFLSAWKGVRLSPDSLLVGTNTEGSRRPLFWCVNAFDHFEQLAKRMDSDQPVYGMRSLHRTDLKSDSTNLSLAHRYLQEIIQIQSKGPYLVGGFCEGGKIAFEIARLLKMRGESIASLILHDQFIASPYSGRVAMFVSKIGRTNPYHNFVDAPRGWRKYYAGDLQLYKINGRHKDCFREPNIDIFANQIKREMQRALSYPQDEGLDGRNQLQRLPLDAYQAQLEASPPSCILPGSSFKIDVRITNISNYTWLPTMSSGLVIGANWVNSEGATKYWMVGSSDIPETIHPGESLTLPMKIRAPFRLNRFYLELDLVDDGVSWFREMGSTSYRHLVKVSMLAL